MELVAAHVLESLKKLKLVRRLQDVTAREFVFSITPDGKREIGADG